RRRPDRPVRDQHAPAATGNAYPPPAARAAWWSGGAPGLSRLPLLWVSSARAAVTQRPARCPRALAGRPSRAGGSFRTSVAVSSLIFPPLKPSPPGAASCAVPIRCFRAGQTDPPGGGALAGDRAG